MNKSQKFGHKFGSKSFFSNLIHTALSLYGSNESEMSFFISKIL